MKKYLMLGLSVLAFVSCNKDNFSSNDGIPAGYKGAGAVETEYQSNFVKTFGAPSADQTWGFGSPTGTANAMRRSMTSPAVLGISAPFTAETLAAAMANAKEVNAANAKENWSGSPDFAVEMKITGTWNGGISVAASEDWGSGDTPETGRSHRNIYVTGTWNIPSGQKIGGKGLIVIGNGGTVNVQSGTLEMVNTARLVVLRGGKLTGNGTVIVNNGNGSGFENYNAGTIDVAVFNNNFGKFYNYGKFLVNEYQGGAQESNFYNHALVAVDHFGGSTANARIFNSCQYYVKHDARIRNYEGVMGSALIVGGQLMFSSSEDGTSTPTYVGLAAGALVKCGTLYNNGTSWEGPTSNGYAALSTGSITFLNWQQDHPEQGGYFANNIYVQADTWTNVPGGNGMGGENAAAKFAKVQNKSGNGNVTVVEKGTYEVIPADNDFELGVKGCTPGFNIKKDDEPAGLPSLHVMAEDLSATEASDFDFNDVVIDVFYVDANTVTIKLLAAGGTLPLRIAQNDAWEVHKLFNVDEKCMVNTGTKYHTPQAPYSQVDGKAAVELTLTGYTWSDDQDEFAAQVRDQVKLEVKKDGIWHEIRADQGQPAAKIATPVNIYMKDAGWYPEEYRWTWEKQGISNLFNQYVSNPSVKWYTTK